MIRNKMSIEETTNEYIELAERMFGSMCSEWVFTGVEFNDQAPHLRYFPETGEISISLSDKAKNDDMQFHFQLAHEVCHLLYPIKELKGGHDEMATVLNEGVSTYFAVFVMESFNYAQECIKSLKENEPDYFGVFCLVGKLLEYDIDSIKKLRKVQPYLNKIEANDFKEAGLAFDEGKIIKLLGEFK